MSNKNLTVDLQTRTDDEGRKFFVGKLQFPGNINTSDGVVFLVFTSEAGLEELQIAPMDKKNK